MSWRILYIEESEHLSLYLDNIKINKIDDEILIPLSDIHSIIIDNYKTTLSIQLINAIVNFKINLVTCDLEHMPNSITTSLLSHHMTLDVQRKQLAWSQKQKDIAHNIIVKNKIYNQRMLLEFIKSEEETINKLKGFEEEVVDGDAYNREGLSAKMYFRCVFGKNFIRFNDDVINAGLNYGYAVLRSQISRTLVSKGLNTAFGIFHKGPQNNFNLSDDFIEPFRPIIDYYVYLTLKEEKIFQKQHRLDLVKQTTKKMFIDQNRQTIFNTMNIFIDSILSFFETGNIDQIKKPIIKYEDL